MRNSIEIQKKSRSEALSELKAVPTAWEKFLALTKEYQEELISFAMGEQGLRITYDGVFRKILDPKAHPERLESLLSAILEKPIKIVEVLDREGIHLSEKAAFVIMDIVVKDAEGNYITLEMQKVGYKFPLQRADCYSADLIMRQYDRLKKEKGDKFYFSHLSKVMTVIVMENSSHDFSRDHTHAIHHRYNVFDTGLPAEGSLLLTVPTT